MPRGRDPGRRGQALVETALVLILFLTLVFGIFDLGRVFLADLALNGASSIATDYGTTADTTSQTGYPSGTQVADKARSAYGPAIDPQRAAVEVDTAATLQGKAALKVTIRYSLPLVSPFLGFAFPGNNVALTGTAVRLYP